MFNTVKGQHLQLRCCPELFHSVKQFNIKVAKAYHPIIQKEVDELLVKDATEPLIGDSFTQIYLFFLGVMVVYDPYLILSNLITVIFLHLFGSINLISGKFYHLGWLKPLQLSFHLLKHTVPFQT